MPNKNYLRGVKFERDLVNKARAQGLISGRMAGSHSPYDLYIIDAKLEHVMFIQCKTKKAKKEKISEKWVQMSPPMAAQVTFEKVTKYIRGK